jgi:hypothetical protein
MKMTGHSESSSLDRDLKRLACITHYSVVEQQKWRERQVLYVKQWSPPTLPTKNAFAKPVAGESNGKLMKEIADLRSRS